MTKDKDSSQDCISKDGVKEHLAEDIKDYQEQFINEMVSEFREKHNICPSCNIAKFYDQREKEHYCPSCNN